MGRTDLTVRELVDKVNRGELQLPEMQRGYVWTSTKVRDLLDSLYRGYPSGVILTWQSNQAVETREFAIATGGGGANGPLLLLDGQQRLTSLAAVLGGRPVTVRNRKRPVDILFNLDHPEELTFITQGAERVPSDDQDDTDDQDDDLLTRVNRRAFIVASNAVASQDNWVRVTDVFTHSDRDLLRAAGVSDMEDPRYERYSQRLQQLRAIERYVYRVDILENTKSYEEVTEIFVRVNSLGAKLRSSDLALAQITAKWNGSLALFNEYQAKTSKAGFDLDLGVHLRTLVAIATGQSKFIRVGTLSRNELATAWERSKRALDFAANFIRTNVHVDSSTLLSSPLLFVTTAYWASVRDYQISTAEADGFARWFLIANAKGRYSRGSSETLLDQDLAVLRQGGGPSDLVDRLLQQVGRLDFTASDLRGRTSRSGAFKTLFLAFRARGARDWATNLAISPKHSGAADAIEFHHIFPKAYLREARLGYDNLVVDELANLAFIGARTNKQISARAPRDYVEDFSSADLAMQCVSFDGGLDVAEAFPRFIERRLEELAGELNSFLRVGA